MPSRSQECPSRSSVSSDRETRQFLPGRDSAFAASLTSSPSLQGAPAHHDMGLATYSHDRDHELMTRSFLFRDEQVRSVAFNPGHPAGHGQDQQSNCTSFDGLDSVQSPGHVAHCYTNTDIDRSAQVFNGDVARAYDSSSTREHHLHGGSVKNKSRLVNGDLDRDTFLALFCGAEVVTRQERSRPEDTRHRRHGPRQGARMANRANPETQN
ncbi:hypothetical protein N7504_002626 [Penicillium tannophilum]|nr:hypothetical protein N7504_002626 [Penicillium tannophilum]